MNQETKTYNGWSNYHTWLLNLNLSNDQGTYNMVKEWIKENPKENFEYGFERGEAFKDFLEEIFFVEDYNVVKICDSWDLTSWAEVDFDEVINSWEEE